MKKKYIVGESYPFVYVKKVVLDETFYILEDYEGERFLLPEYYYKNYGLKMGEPVQCRILRIDCSGKVSIEPEHAYYKPDHVYEFKLLKKEIIEEENSRKFSVKAKTLKKYCLIVQDPYKNEHIVKVSKKLFKSNFESEKVLCKIKHITKGNFELELIEKKQKKGLKKFLKKMSEKSRR